VGGLNDKMCKNIDYNCVNNILNIYNIISMNTSYRTVSQPIDNASSAILKLNIARCNADIALLEGENSKLNTICNNKEALIGKKLQCAEDIAKNEHQIYNLQARIRTYNSQLAGIAPNENGGSRRKTLKGRRKNKSRRNRKSRR
jgi:hypothetical protein